MMTSLSSSVLNRMAHRSGDPMYRLPWSPVRWLESRLTAVVFGITGTRRRLRRYLAAEHQRTIRDSAYLEAAALLAELGREGRDAIAIATRRGVSVQPLDVIPAGTLQGYWLAMVEGIECTLPPTERF
jgi:hypothetical protein